jgi:hypothetical protein
VRTPCDELGLLRAPFGRLWSALGLVSRER